MTTSAHEMGDPEQSLPGTENQQEYTFWDEEQREAKKEGKLFEPEPTKEDDVTANQPKSAAATDRPEGDTTDASRTTSATKTASAKAAKK